MQNNTSTKFEGGDKYMKWVSMVHEKKNPRLSLAKCVSLLILLKAFAVSVEKSCGWLP